MKSLPTVPVLMSLQYAVLLVAGTLGYLLRQNILASWAVWIGAGAVALAVLFRPVARVNALLIFLVCPFLLVLALNLLLLTRGLDLAVPVLRYFLIIFIAALALSTVPLDGLRRIVGALPVILVLQVPILLLQHVVYVPRSGSWDSAVGSFGGDPFGGGNSAGLGIFLLLALVWVVARYRNGLISLRSLLLQGAIVLACAAMAEIKMFVLVSAIGVVLCYRDLIVKSPAKFLLAVSAAAGLVVLMAYAYWRVFYSGFVQDLDGFIAYVAPELTGQDIYVSRTGEVGRITALRYWWEQNSQDVGSLLLGQGLFSTQTSESFAFGGATRFQLGNTTATALLWEVGVVGFATYLAPFGASALLAARKRLKGGAEVRSISEVGVVGSVAWVLFLFHSLTQYQTPQSQWLGALVLGIGFSGLRYRDHS